ncbi:topoisomerase II [Kaistella sp. G5-32]|uniref:Topoisomerase II n=1 Tax=Kaistella gelatinilytica TaxID=2787636 RepID=A0ABS0FDY5_9FLAO|nr:topoisomerase II [Kaistella gelatinilytica]MBF8457910.1 topoisomerase II [Kaistella gelatinilytica]
MISFKQESLTLEELEVNLSAELIAHQEKVLQKYSVEKEKECSLPSLHGTIGGKNNQYADIVNTQFSDPREFIAHWVRGFIKYVGKSKSSPLRTLLKDDEFREYTFTFLERNFYRNLIERTRFKPNQSLWSIWFGSGNLIWGLIIAPANRGKQWTNDVSEIRRAKYQYWTIGHIMETGLIDPESEYPIKFSKIEDLMTFYRSVLKRVSNSTYENRFCDLYMEYLLYSDAPMEEPFLIPEFRYLGLEKNHEHRLDFTILNPHTRELIGIELSPNSTHMAVSGIKDKTQKKVNEELSAKWDKEMKKRNDYFSSFDIFILTFTDENLKDIDACFIEIKKYLSARLDNPIILEEELERLKNI